MRWPGADLIFENFRFLVRHYLGVCCYKDVIVLNIRGATAPFSDGYEITSTSTDC